MRTSSLVAALLVGRVGADSLTMAMAKIKADAGFDPHEPPKHKTDIKVGLYLEHLLDVSIEEHTFDMDFYLTEEWLDERNYRSAALLSPAPRTGAPPRPQRLTPPESHPT